MNRQDTGVLVVKILCANSREKVRIIEKPDALGLRIYKKMFPMLISKHFQRQKNCMSRKERSHLNVTFVD